MVSARALILMTACMIVCSNVLMCVVSQSTVGQFGTARYRHSCTPDARCHYSLTLPECRQGQEGCQDADDRDHHALLQTVTQLFEIVQSMRHQLDELVLPKDCSGVESRLSSGVQKIKPNGKTFEVDVYCESGNTGIWTVIQRRLDGSVNFNRTWSDYKWGFGNKDSEYWLGNDNIHALTNQARYKLRIDLEDWDNATAYAEYEEFWIDDESHNYTLHLGEYLGTAGDALRTKFNLFDWNLDGQPFSTIDRENDQYVDHCALDHGGGGGWWYNGCAGAKLNGIYHNEPTIDGRGLRWYSWRQDLSLKKVTMKIQRTNDGDR